MRSLAPIIGLLCGLWAAGSAQAADPVGRTPQPVIEKARAGTQCVADSATMRRTHMDLLKHQRNDTVHGGVRNGRHSLKDCIACHASARTGSVAAADTDFCASCHRYAAVSIDCFECHNSRPAAKAVAKSAPGGNP